MTHHFDRPIAALGAVLFLVGPALARDPPLLSLDMEHFRDTASLTDGGSSVALSTEPGFTEHRGPLRTVWNDEYLQAILEKSGGAKSFEVDAVITYTGARRSYRRATYRTPQGPRETPARLVQLEAVNCPIECVYTEHLAFALDPQLMRDIAAGYAPGKARLWQFKLLAKSGPAYQGELSNAEFAGLLAKVDAYGEAPVLAASQAPPAPRPRLETPRPIDFGIGGIAVRASADMPKRAGVLVASVTAGSPAQRAGLITGDIIYGFDARPIAAPADLEAAAAASTAGSSVVIKLFRGTSELRLAVKF